MVKPKEYTLIELTEIVDRLENRIRLLENREKKRSASERAKQAKKYSKLKGEIRWRKKKL